MAKTKPKPPYRKLTRMSRTIGLMTQLWLGEDHLLQVQSTGYTETYQRFYLRDIQALLVVHSARRLYIATTLGVILGISLLIALGNDAEWPVYAWIGGLMSPFLVWNQLLGPGCRVTIITAVRQERIPSLARLPKTRRVLAELKTLIETAQADLVRAPQGPDTSVAAATPSSTEPPVVARGDAPVEVPPMISPISGAGAQPPPLPPPLPPTVS